MATIYEVAEAAGVSLATVSRVMNDSSRVSAKTRAKVLASMEQLNYRPNAIARSLASNISNSVGIMVPELHGPFFGSMVSGIEQELRKAGKHVIITIGHSEDARERDGIEFLMGRRCDALIIHVDGVTDNYLMELCRGPIPVVVMNRHVPTLSDCCISIDNELGGYIEARHLLEQGHSQIAYVAGPLWKHDAAERLAGHQRALGEFGVAYEPRRTIEGDYTETSGGVAMQDLIARDVTFSAVACANDGMAAGAMRVARDAGVHIPDDISIIGFDNVNFARYLHPNLTTIDFPVNAMGHMAARWVLRNVYGDANIEVQTMFEPTLVVRESVAAMAGAGG